MTIDEIELFLYDMCQMDIWLPLPPTFKWKENLKIGSYSNWSVEEFKSYLTKRLYPKTSGTLEEFVEIATEFYQKMADFSSINSTNSEMFSIARVMAFDILDLLRAMK